MSIRLKLTILFLAIAVIPILFVSALTFHNYTESLEAIRIADLQNITTFKADKIETYFFGLKANIETSQSLFNIKHNLPILSRLAEDPNNKEFADAKKMLDEQLNRMQTVLGITDIMLVNPEGKVVYSSNPEHYPRNFLNPLPDPGQKAFTEGKEKIYLSDSFLNKDDENRPGMLLTAPAADSNNVFIGVIVFELDLREVYKIFEDVTGLGNTGEVLAGKKAGNEVIYLNPLRHDIKAALTRTIPLGEEIGGPIQEAVQGKNGSGRLTDYRGRKVIASWRYIPSLDWGMVAKIDTDEAFADVTNLRNLSIVLLFIIIILSSIAAFSIAHSISEPIKQLSDGAAIIGSGNLDYKIGTSHKDEIGQLSRTFDKMTLNLKQTLASRDELNREIAERKKAEESLREGKSDLDRAQAVAHSGSWRLDIRQNKLTWSDEAYRIFSVPIGKGMSYETFLSYIHPDDKEYVDTKWKAALAGEKYDIEHRIVVDGQIKWVRERAELEIEKDGSLLGGFGTVTDITSMKEAEATLLREKNFTDTTIDSLPGVFYLFNEQGRFLRWNKNFEKVTEYSSSEMANISPLDLFRGDDKKIIAERIREVIEKGETLVEASFVTKSGLSIPYFFTGKRIMFDQKPCVVGMGINIAERKKMEEELRKSHDEMEMRVKERTADLDESVKELQTQVEHRIKAEETIKAERKRLEDVLEMMPAYAVLLTPDYHVAYANRTFRDWFGDDNGKKCYEFLFNRTEPCENCETYNVMKTGKSQFWEWTGPNGHNYDIYDYPFTDTDGSPLIMEIGVDVTTHKQAQKAVRQGEERYRSLTEATTQIVWTTDAQGQVVGDMPSWREFTGQTIEEMQGWGWINSLHPDDREHTSKIWTQSVQNKTLYETEYRIRRYDGVYRDVSVRGVPVLEQDGSIREWIGTCTDITERKSAEERQGVTNTLLELYAKKATRIEYLDSAVEAIRDWSGCSRVGVRVKDDKGNIPYESFVGFEKDFITMENPLHLGRDKCLCMRAILQQPVEQDKKLLTPGGSLYSNDSLAFVKGLSHQQAKDYRGNCMKHGFQSIAVVPIRYRDEVVGVIHLADSQKNMVPLTKIQFIETTIAPLVGEAIHRFSAESQLEKYRLHLEDLVKNRTEELVRSNKDLEQFAYVASHDLQEPLRAVSGFVELLRINLKKSLDEKTNEYMNFSIDGAKRMQSLINDLLEYSRIGTQGKKPQKVNSKDALDEALARLHASIAESGAKIIADDLPTVYFDDLQLARLFQNLIGNAIKFRSEETPQIHISAVRKDAAWQFVVRDNGIGIEPQYAERIFMIFQRLHTRKTYPGTGIGLSICKKIVERHGGKIWVESSEGHGSTFYFTVPDIEGA